MKHKVSELKGKRLDEAVAAALGFPGQGWYREKSGRICREGDLLIFAPTEFWEQAGPIIERERLTVQATQSGGSRAFLGDGTTNAGTGRRGNETMIQALAPTPLIAAMRAFVASKLGEEVELP